MKQSQDSTVRPPSKPARRRSARAREVIDVRAFLASAHVFASAVRDVMEPKLLGELPGPRIGPSQLSILQLLRTTGTQNVGEVAAFLGVSNAAASKAVDKLVRLELLARTEAVPDRRAARLALTAAGKRLLVRYEELRSQELAKILRSLPAREVRSSQALLTRLAAAIVRQVAGPEQVCLQCGLYSPEQCLLRMAAGRDCSYLRYQARGKAPRQGW